MQKISLQQIEERGIKRVCHFTKAKNLGNILGEAEGILATENIPKHLKDINDTSRLDKKLDYICCSIEYPNIYFLNVIKDRDKLFKEWVILIIKPDIITDAECLFSPVNAATEYGKYIEGGRLGFSKLFSTIITTNKKTRYRQKDILKCCPTDLQAEVLVKKFIPKDYIEAVVVPNEEEGIKQKLKLGYLGLENKIKIIVSPDMFDKACYSKIKEGIRMDEYLL